MDFDISAREGKIKILLITLAVVLIVAVLAAVIKISREKQAETPAVSTDEQSEEIRKIDSEESSKAYDIPASDDAEIVPLDEKEVEKAYNIPASSDSEIAPLSEEEVRKASNVKN